MADPTDDPKPDLIPRAEAQAAFKARDEAKRALREAQEQGLLLTPEEKAEWQKIRDQAAKSAEERQRKAGEFDQLRADLLKKHEESLQAVTKQAETVRAKLHETLKSHEFAAAREWFGGADAKTILTPAIAAAYFGRFVQVETTDDGRERVIVTGLDGHPILDPRTGQPAPFGPAMGQLIEMLPDKDSILRGSGKTGSGSSGGASGGVSSFDVEELTRRAATGDATAIKQLRERQASLGGMQMGTTFSRRAG